MNKRTWEGLSPDVEAVLSGGARRQEDRRLSPAQKRERARQAARVRMTLDLPDWLKDELLRVATQEETTASSVAAFFIARGIRNWGRGAVRLPKVPSESPRFEFLVEVTEGDAGL
jgi:hypothetical protein